jgi:hypothetical protein
VESEATTTRVNLIADGGADEAHPVDDANLMGLIAAVILERPTCLGCLAMKVSAPMPSVLRVLERIGKSMTVHITNNERCRACGSTEGPVYSLKRPQ